MTIISQIIRRQSCEPLWISEQDAAVDTKQLLSRISAVRPSFRLGRSVIKPATDVDFVELFCALDGVAREVLIIHPDSAQSDNDNLIHEFKPDCILTNIDEIVPDSTSAHQTDYLTDWLIPTSGTTGTPKIIRHNIATLCRSIRYGFHTPLPRWGLLYGATRFAGLQVVLQSLLGEGTLLIPAEQGDLLGTLRFLARNGCNSLSATPTLWRKALMSPAFDSLKLSRITLGGEIADQNVLGALRLRFPCARIAHIYATTETGVVFSVTDGEAGFPRDWIETGTPEGLKLAIISGELHLGLQRANVSEGAETLLNTGDAVSIHGNRVHFLGRVNGAINVGGNKVMPEEVEAVLLGHPYVHLARVTGRKSAFTGMLVAAEVVLSADAPPVDSSQLQKYCLDRLEEWKVPAVIRFLTDLQIGGSGKIQRSVS